MESKRVKITFSDNYTIIDPKKVAEANKRISENMKPFIREHKRKMAQSIIDSGNKI